MEKWTFVGIGFLSMLVACGPAEVKQQRQDAVAQARPVAATTATPDPAPTIAAEATKVAQAEEHLEAAGTYRERGELGLALEELRQALALQPDHRFAQEMRSEIGADATATVVEGRAQATAEAVRVARAEATAEARARAVARATITAYARVPPKGFWVAVDGDIEVNVRVIVGNFQYASRWGFSTASRGSRFVVLSIGVRNEGRSNIHVNPFNVTLVDQSGSSYAHDASTYSCTTPLQAVDVRPGNRADGCVVFLTSSSSGPANIVYRTGLIGGRDVVVDLEQPPDLP